ncbi:MAG: hypothetical protein FRX48_05737 [Lasallia pustulata]|uniref:DUF4219 domain-containing protein n=1 Tax=Lasallia pustulata TaxID=136370 RepID=A0A5M8PN31_9LECA|nr:MAG: hypothetical protein FRX48_05737 [Lasallia pustulata]
MDYKLPRGATPIPQLNDTNYRTWAIYVKNYLRAQGYWDVVDGGTTQALTPEGKKWDMADARAWLAIAACCSEADAILPSYKEESARELWERLERTKKPRGSARRAGSKNAATTA